MQKVKLCKRMLALLMTGTMVTAVCNDIVVGKAETRQMANTITKGEKKNYIVAAKGKNVFEKKFVDSDTVNQQEEQFLEKNDLFTLELNNSEVKRLEGDSSVQYIEEDVDVQANALYTVKHSKKVKRYKKNKSGMEWNIRMIHGQQKRDVQNKKKVKIAVLDSGVGL